METSLPSCDAVGSPPTHPPPAPNSQSLSIGRLTSIPLSCEGFCTTFVYDSNDRDCDGDKNYNFDRRMEHIREHIMGDGYSASGMRPDGGLISHLKRERIVNSQTHKEILERVNPTSAPPIPGGRYSRSSEHVEEIASSSRTRRHEKKEKHESSKKKHMR